MTPRPYLHTKRAGKTVDVHKIVWEAANGPVPDGYLVHHVNGNKHDNRLSNLALMTHEEHSRHHNDRHARERACDSCGSRYTPNAKHRGMSRTCSGRCFRDLGSRQRAGTGNGMARLTDDAVRDIRARVAAGAQQKTLAAEYGVSPMAISRVVHRKGWAHVQ